MWYFIPLEKEGPDEFLKTDARPGHGSAWPISTFQLGKSNRTEWWKRSSRAVGHGGSSFSSRGSRFYHPPWHFSDKLVYSMLQFFLSPFLKVDLTKV